VTKHSRNRAPRSRCQAILVPCPLHRCAKARLLDVSSARNVRINVDFAWLLGIRTLQVKNAHCAKVLICLVSSSSDQGAPCAFYLAIARSAVCSLPLLLGPSLNCDRKDSRPSAPGAVSRQVCCSRYAASSVVARASRVAKSTEATARERQLLCLFCANRARHRGTKLDRQKLPILRLKRRRACGVARFSIP
jgi:hypothetical protein